MLGAALLHYVHTKMIEKIIKKYGELKSRDSVYEIELRDKNNFERLKQELEQHKYEVTLIKQEKNIFKIKITKNLFEKFLDLIKRYKEGIPPEDIRYIDEE